MKKRYLVTLAAATFVMLLVLSGCFLLPKVLTAPHPVSPANGATDVSTTTVLSWNPSNIKAEYELFFGTDENPTLATSTYATSVAESNLKYSTTYYWKVEAAANGKTAASSEVSFTTAGIPVPSAPKLSVSSVLTDSISLEWTRSAFASSVELYEATSGAFARFAALPGTSISFRAESLSPSTAYRFFAVGVNASGRATSDTVTATTDSKPLPIVGSFSVTSVSTDTVTLGWETSRASTVCLYTSPSDSLLATVSDGSSPYTVSGLAPSTAYGYFIAAVNPTGRATSDTLTATTLSYTKRTRFEIYIGDKPVPVSSIQHLYVNFTGFSIRTTFGGTSTWHTSQAGGTYDLTALSGNFAGAAELSVPASAVVTQIKFGIENATAVINGTSYTLSIPGSAIYLDTQSLNAGTMGSAYLDFDLSLSVEDTGSGYEFRPIVHVVGGNSRASVTGKVVYESKPVSGAIVYIDDSSTVVTEAYTDENGEFTIGAVSAGTYTLKIDAVATDVSEYSTRVSFSTGSNDLGTIALSQVPPKAPVLSLSSKELRSVVLNWTNCANADGYRLWESTSPGSAMVQTAALPSSVTSLTLKIKPATNYYFAVSSYNSGGQSWSGKVNADNVQKIVATIPIAGLTYNLAVDPVLNAVYVVEPFRSLVDVINGTTNTIATSVTVEGTPMGIGVNPTTHTIYTSGFYSGKVNVINGITDKVATTLHAGYSSFGVGVNTVTNTVYLSNVFSNEINVIDGTTNTVATNLKLDTLGFGISVNSVTNRVYITNYASNTLVVLNGSDNSIVKTVTVGASPPSVCVNPTTDTIYVVNASDSVSVVDGTTNTVTGTVPVGDSPIGIGVNPTTNLIYVTCSNSIYIIDGETNTVVETVPVSALSFSVGVNPLTNMIYFADASSGNVYVLNGN